MKVAVLRRNQAANAARSTARSLLRCPSCKATNPPDAMQCPFCGTWFVSAVVCGICRAVIAPQIDHCCNCHTPLADCNPQPYKPYPVAAARLAGYRRSTHRGDVLALFLALVIAATLIATILLGHGPVVVRPMVAVLVSYIIMAGFFRWSARQTLRAIDLPTQVRWGQSTAHERRERPPGPDGMIAPP